MGELLFWFIVGTGKEAVYAGRLAWVTCGRFGDPPPLLWWELPAARRPS